jgi:UDP-N-acetylglucosamine acyltransferase
MAYAHIGHNCTVGNNNLISNSTGLSGHVTIEDKTVIGGFVGVHQYVHIGKMAMIGGLSKVVQDVPPFCTCDGRPAKVMASTRAVCAATACLPSNASRSARLSSCCIARI